MKLKHLENNFALFRNVKWLITSILVGVLVFVVSHTLPTRAQSLPVVIETLTVPFTNYQAVMSAQSYTGEVLIVVSGTGQASGSDYTDAFYRFTGGGLPLEIPVIANEFGLEMDGGIAGTLLESAPKYASDHIYVFSYDVGTEARPLGFRVADGAQQDNTGEFAVRIVPLP